MADSRKTVLITGTSSGIGESLALEFQSKGLRVLATARKAESLTKLAAAGIETFSLEVDKPESIAKLKEEISQVTGGKLDFLVNNAGMNFTVPAVDFEYDGIQQLFEVNVFAVMRMCQAFAPLLIEAKGTIVQIGSVAAIVPYVFSSAYNATKAALHAYSNTLRVELSPFGVKVVTVVTGGVQSKISRTDRQLPPNSIYQPINAEYQRRVNHSQEGAMPSADYARSVVKQVLPSNPPLYVWEGNRSWQIWFVNTFLTMRIMDFTFSRMFNLSKLAGTQGSKAKKA